MPQVYVKSPEALLQFANQVKSLEVRIRAALQEAGENATRTLEQITEEIARRSDQVRSCRVALDLATAEMVRCQSSRDKERRRDCAKEAAAVALAQGALLDAEEALRASRHIQKQVEEAVRQCQRSHTALMHLADEISGATAKLQIQYNRLQLYLAVRAGAVTGSSGAAPPGLEGGGTQASSGTVGPLDEAALNSLIARCQQRIRQGVADFRDAIEVGTLLRDAVEQPLLPIKNLKARTLAERNEAIRNHNVAEVLRLDAQLENLVRLMQDQRGNEAFRALSRLRSMGQGNPQAWTPDTPEAVKAAAMRVTCWLPTEWVNISSRHPMRGQFETAPGVRGSYAYIGVSIPEMNLYSTDPFTNGLHEFEHRFEHLIPRIKAFEKGFFEYRSVGPELKTVTPEGHTMYSRKDHWPDKYCERFYPVSGSFELMSVGVQLLFVPWARQSDFGRDAEYEAFVLGVLASL